jgi:hypothetical protein
LPQSAIALMSLSIGDVSANGADALIFLMNWSVSHK